MELETSFSQLIIGLVALFSNMLSAFAGGGAGLIQLPSLILLGLPFSMALATHKLASVALGVGASLRHIQEGSLNKGLAAFVLCCGLPGVFLGTQVVLFFPERVSTLFLGMLTLWIGYFSMRRPQLGITQKQIPLIHTRWLFGGAVLFVIGFLNGSLSSGTGLLVTLWLVQWFGLSYNRAVAYTLILVGLFWNGTGAIFLGLGGDIKWSWVPMLVFGSLIGGYLGAHLSLEKGSRMVKRVFELISFFMGISLIFRSLF